MNEDLVDQLRAAVGGDESWTIDDVFAEAIRIVEGAQETREELDGIDQDALEAGQDLAEHGLTRERVHTALWRARLICLHDDPWEALARGLGV